MVSAWSPLRVHIFGASGSGTTTLGRALARAEGAAHFDTDDFYWVPSDPPYQMPRDIGPRLQLLGAALDRHESWVLSGSLDGWGDTLIPRFKLGVFIHLDTEIRLERLRLRELADYGAEALRPGGAMHEVHVEFLNWAARYDGAGPTIRSRIRHDAWIAQLPYPVLRLNGTLTTEEQVARVRRELNG